MNGPTSVLRIAPKLASRWMPLLDRPTPVHSFTGASEVLGHPELYIKREDQTDHRYGGNKVRNLEFLLGDAVNRGARRVVTVAPLGSNFVAALAAQAARIGIPARVFHFVPAASPQIAAHYRFSAAQGAEMRLFGGHPYWGAARAWGAMQRDLCDSAGGYLLAPGGSSALGALGHVNATLELAGQVERGEIPEPDVIIVGAGTCGTMAGLLAGLRLTSLSSRLIGVRCVDRIVCNPRRIARLANATLGLLGSRVRALPIRASDVDLREPAERPSAYGTPLGDAPLLMRQIRIHAGIELDTTYTSKVMSFLKQEIARGRYRGQRVLYWNTFSPAAMTHISAIPMTARLPRLA